MPLPNVKRRVKRKFVEPLARGLEQLGQRAKQHVVERLVGPPHTSLKNLPPEMRGERGGPVVGYYDYAVITGRQAGPAGGRGAYAVADGESGDVTRFPLPADPNDPKSVFVENGVGGIVKSVGGASIILDIPGTGMYHFKRDDVTDLRAEEERINPLDKWTTPIESSPVRKTSRRSLIVHFSSRRARLLTVRVAAFERLAGPERVGILQGKYPGLAPFIQRLADKDPTGGQQKYLDWATRMLAKARKAEPEGDLTFLADGMADAIERFHQVQKYLGKGDLKDAAKDINQYKTPEALVQMLRDAAPTFRKHEADYEVVFEDEDWIAYDSKNKAANCSLATNINPSTGYSYWCVSRPEQTHYESYTRGQAYTQESGKGWRFILIKSKKDESTQYLAYIAGDAVSEIKDYHDNDPSPGDVPLHVLENLGIEFNEDTLDPEAQEVDIYYLIWADSIVMASESLHAVRNYAGDDVNIRGGGYEIWNGTVTLDDWEDYEDNPRRLDIFNEQLMESVDPETEERFVVAPWETDSVNDALKDHWTIEADEETATNWVEENKEEWAEQGYKIFKVDVTVDQIESEQPRYWDVYGDDVVEEREPFEEGTVNAEELVEVFFTTSTKQEPSVVGDPTLAWEIRDMQRDEASLQRAVMRDAETVYKSMIPLRAFRRLLRNRESSRILGRARLENVEKVRDIPADLVQRFLLYRDDAPDQAFSESHTREEAAEFTETHAKLFPFRSYELKQVTVPYEVAARSSIGLNWDEFATESTTIQKYEKSYVSGVHEVAVDSADLTSFPIGTEMSQSAPNLGPQTILDWVKTGTEGSPPSDSTWKNLGTGEERSGARFFPFRGATRDLLIRFPSSAVEATQSKEEGAESTAASEPTRLDTLEPGAIIRVEQTGHLWVKAREPQHGDWYPDTQMWMRMQPKDEHVVAEDALQMVGGYTVTGHGQLGVPAPNGSLQQRILRLNDFDVGQQVVIVTDTSGSRATLTKREDSRWVTSRGVAFDPDDVAVYDIEQVLPMSAPTEVPTGAPGEVPSEPSSATLGETRRLVVSPTTVPVTRDIPMPQSYADMPAGALLELRTDPRIRYKKEGDAWFIQPIAEVSHEQLVDIMRQNNIGGAHKTNEEMARFSWAPSDEQPIVRPMQTREQARSEPRQYALPGMEEARSASVVVRTKSDYAKPEKKVDFGFTNPEAAEVMRFSGPNVRGTKKKKTPGAVGGDLGRAAPGMGGVASTDDAAEATRTKCCRTRSASVRIAPVRVRGSRCV